MIGDVLVVVMFFLGVVTTTQVWLWLELRLQTKRLSELKEKNWVSLNELDKRSQRDAEYYSKKLNLIQKTLDKHHLLLEQAKARFGLRDRDEG